MDRPNEQFTPEQVDEQIAHLLKSLPATLPAASFIQEVHDHYQEEHQMLESAWKRLSNVLDEREHSAIERDSSPGQSLTQPTLSKVERPGHMKQRTPRKPMTWLASFVAAVLVVLLIS